MWVYSYDPETKVQSSQWKLPGYPCPKKARQSHSKVETKLTVFSDWKGAVHRKYAPLDQTINKEYYLNVFHWLRDKTKTATAMGNW